uniref:Phosphate-specific transport system accessory protein PhoU n=1 Tax=Magnetococcus massalia (strain MO-1) TaxID=451514 RepID=A0A1S7LF88_MAGMO|nr:Phosphate transport system protein phoU [Candidatus Magnetococcus massalia]
MSTGERHTVQAFDAELKEITSEVVTMSELVLKQLSMAMESVASLSEDEALQVIEQDQQVDNLEWEIENQVTRILALREPKADDLRRVIAVMKMSNDLERMGDLAANISKRTLALVQNPPGSGISALKLMVNQVQSMSRDVMQAFIDADDEATIQVWNRDREVDELFNSVFREYLTYMMENPRNISPYTHLLFIAKNVERIGDHVTNIAENVHFVIKGTPLQGKRPKADLTCSTVVSPPA